MVEEQLGADADAEDCMTRAPYYEEHSSNTGNGFAWITNAVESSLLFEDSNTFAGSGSC